MTFPRRAAAAVLTLGLATSLTACADDESRDRNDLEGTWVLVEFDEADIKADPAVTTTITLSGGKVTGNAGVNTVNGTYDAPEDGKVSFGPLVSTKKMGPENAQLQEDRFLKEIERVQNFEFDTEDEELELKDDKDNTLLVMRAE